MMIYGQRDSLTQTIRIMMLCGTETYELGKITDTQLYSTPSIEHAISSELLRNALGIMANQESFSWTAPNVNQLRTELKELLASIRVANSRLEHTVYAI